MSAPKIPDRKPEEALVDIIESIALEETALAHIINAEGEKVQKAVSLAKSVDDLIDANEAVDKTLKTVIMKEILLQIKFQQVCDVLDCFDTGKGKKKRVRTTGEE